MEVGVTTKIALQSDLEEFRMEFILSYDHDLEKEKEKVHFLHTNIDPSELGLFKVIQDGKLV